MGTARQDFERFLRWLHDPERLAPEPARCFANLVLANFDAISAKARQRNSRSVLLAAIARDRLSATNSGLPQSEQHPPQGLWPWSHLSRITVGPFRGFRHPQEFDLNKGIVLCYGPNGSGKSSLCEALEYSLLGSVEEAGSKRIDNRAYLANIHEGRFSAPLLLAIDAHGHEVAVTADHDLFRFCFVEKNRIDNFSRIAATAPSRKTDLIATLFGMDQFNDFATNFNESMDAVLSLGTTAQDDLSSKRNERNTDEATRDSEAKLLHSLDEEAEQYAATIAPNLDFRGLTLLVEENSEKPSRLQELEAALHALLPTPTNISREQIAALYANAESSAQRADHSQRELDSRLGEVSFRKLFDAVKALRDEYSDRCPACNTPLSESTSNPFDRADAGLHELEELAGLELEHERLINAAREASRELRSGLRGLVSHLESDGQSETFGLDGLRSLLGKPDSADWWKADHAAESNATQASLSIEHILVLADRAAARDARIREAIQRRAQDASEHKRLSDARVWIATHNTRRLRVEQDAEQARRRVAQWEDANADQIRLAEDEAQANQRDQPIKDAYDSFYALLERFREQLPSMLMSDLNASTLQLYNEFNHRDRNEDKLADLRLPLTAEGVIEIAFRGDPQHHVNALTALSEGHIRCLGLAILLAKAESIGAPLIIFDDAINAIDHDHRSGIRQAMFETDRFRRTQVIVTCHSPEFVKDIENNLPRTRRPDCKQYALLHHQGDHQPRVNPDVGSQNYLVRAREAIDERFDPRDALSFARKSLEMLTDRIWKWMDSHRVGRITVLMEGPNSDPPLRNLCEALRKGIVGNSTFNHANRKPLVDNLDVILGIPERTLAWSMLNKGTHEEADRDDFDMDHVETILKVLTDIDRLELRPNK